MCVQYIILILMEEFAMENRKTPSTTRDLVLTGILVAFGLLLPYVAGHAAGLPGAVLLPMHIPVLLCGFFCGPRFGALCGLVVPVLSCVITGMPVAFPMLPIMACELLTYGMLCGLFYRGLRLPVFAALPMAMLGGRVVYGLVFALLTAISAAPLKALSVWGAVTTGLPGILIQLALVPLLVKAVERRETRIPAPEREEEPWLPALMEQAKRLRKGEFTCIVLQNGQVVYEADGRGVSPLMALYNTDKAKLRGAEVADKIIGKAAAMIIDCGGGAAVYGEIMSKAAREYLEHRGIPYRCGRCVDIISNRTGNGICPIEKSVMEVQDAQTGVKIISETVKSLRQTG